MDLRLWVVDLGPHPLDPTVWSPLLDATEQAAATAKRHASDRALYVVRHAVLRTILGEVLAIAPADVPLDRAPCPLCGGPHGRPVVAGDAFWRPATRDDELRAAGSGDTSPAFSLASAPGVVAVVVSPAAVEVGVDVEVTARVGADDLAAALHPRERAALDRLPPSHHRDLAALRCWTRKEALLKGLGTGLGVDPAGVHVGLAPPAVDGPGGRTTTTAAPAGWTFVDLPPVPLVTAQPAVVSLAYRTSGCVTVEVIEVGFAGLMRRHGLPHVEPACGPRADIRTSSRSGVG